MSIHVFLPLHGNSDTAIHTSIVISFEVSILQISVNFVKNVKILVANFSGLRTISYDTDDSICTKPA